MTRPTLLASSTRRIRCFVAFMTLMLVAIATSSFASIANDLRGVNYFELAGIPLFAILFAWIAFSFCLATLGFVALWRERIEMVDHVADLHLGDPGSPNIQVEPRERTAVLMPIYNESPDRVMAGIKAMLLDLREQSLQDQFDFYILSDTTNHATWIREEVAWSELMRSLNISDGVFYRHRPQNTCRKAGNIADFVERWGSRHEFMIVLDADSLISGATLGEMVKRMREDDRLGILQVPPVPIGRSSLFARLQQFAASVYGPIFVKGFSLWSGVEGNYWGHNAILRVEAFRLHCDLPVLPGKPPLGGEILSHDFVEAALLVQAGYKVEIATDLGGSYEECPTTLADYAQRDQRWCQGNLQHSKLVASENFRPLSRFHMSCGIMSYLASPIWVLFTGLCMAGMFVETQDFNGVSRFKPYSGALAIFIVSMVMLLLPKLWSVLLVCQSRRERALHGGFVMLCLSSLLETLFSVLLSPIMAIYHTRFVIAALRGKSVRWSAQQRDEHGVTWSEAFGQFSAFTLAGELVALLLAKFAPALFPWFSPLLIGVVFSIPLAVAMGSRKIGLALRSLGALLIPSEIDPPSVCQHLQHGIEDAKATAHYSDQVDWFEDLIHNPRTFAIHAAIQRSTVEGSTMPIHQLKAIEAAFATGGAGSIPLESRSALLHDIDTLKRLHVQAQQ